MFQTSIIVFREILEVALVVGILAAATIGVRGRIRWIVYGLFFGAFGSAVIAFFADRISSSLDGRGQEAFNGAILIIAAIMIGWTLVWMKKHAKQISSNLKKVGKKVSDGEQSIMAIAAITALSVFREGAEIVLFSYGIYASGTSLYEIISGAAIGLIAGTIIGIFLYYGLIKTGKHFFAITSWMLIFLTSGMIASGVGFLASANFIPELGTNIWDSSSLISDSSILGIALHTLFGYISNPSGMQILSYLLTLTILVFSTNSHFLFKKQS